MSECMITNTHSLSSSNIHPHLVERISEGDVCDGLGVLEGGVAPVPLDVLPDELLLLRSAAERDPRLPRQLLPLVDGAPEIILPESTLMFLHSYNKTGNILFGSNTIAIDWGYSSFENLFSRVIWSFK